MHRKACKDSGLETSLRPKEGGCGSSTRPCTGDGWIQERSLGISAAFLSSLFYLFFFPSLGGREAWETYSQQAWGRAKKCHSLLPCSFSYLLLRGSIRNYNNFTLRASVSAENLHSLHFLPNCTGQVTFITGLCNSLGTYQPMWVTLLPTCTSHMDFTCRAYTLWKWEKTDSWKNCIVIFLRNYVESQKEAKDPMPRSAEGMAPDRMSRGLSTGWNKEGGFAHTGSHLK